MTVEGKKEKVLFSREEIQSKVEELGRELSKEYADKDLVIVSLLRGAFIFSADLVRELSVPVEIDFMTTSSYGHGTQSSGDVKIVKDIDAIVKDRDVLIVDDIIDTGYTMERVMNHLKEKEPRSIKICTMLDKPDRREVDLEPDFVGFSIPDLFIVGYGLNYENHYRNIPYIFSFE